MRSAKTRRNRHTTTFRPKGNKTDSCGKVRFETSRGAQAAAILQHDRTGTKLWPYYHFDCLGWHLTSQPQR